MRKVLLNPFGMLITGFIAGLISRLLDIYTQNLGNIFSQMAIWILFGVLISIYSASKTKAMLNIFPFCIGMIATYYLTAIITKGVYSDMIIIGWTIFAFGSPVLAYFTWMTKEEGRIPKIISTGILFVSFLTSIVFFDGPRIYDFIINAVTAYFLFAKRIKR